MKKIFTFCITAVLVISCGSVDKSVKYIDMVADIDPFPIGSASVSFEQTFSSQLKTEDVEVVFYPRENEVALEYGSFLGNYKQFWNKEGRKLFVEALDRYKDDFENRRFINNHNRTKSVYGKSKGRYQWKTLSISPTYRSSPVIELGYRFRNNFPYLATRQLSAKEESGNNEEINQSFESYMYFNRAQAEELARLFDEAFLLSLVEGQGRPATGNDYY